MLLYCGLRPTEDRHHYSDVLTSTMASHITSISTVSSAVCSGAHQSKHQNFVSLIFVRGIHRWPVISPHKGPVMRKIFPFDDVIIISYNAKGIISHIWTVKCPWSSYVLLCTYMGNTEKKNHLQDKMWPLLSAVKNSGNYSTVNMCAL